MKSSRVGPKTITASLLSRDGSSKKKKGKGKSISSSTELAIQVPSRLPVAERRAIKAHFGEASTKIISMLELSDHDNALSMLKKKLLQSAISLLPLAEQMVSNTEGSKGTYQYVTLVSQIRELIGDLEAQRDRKFIAQNLIAEVIRPAFMDLAQFMIEDHHEFRKNMERFVKPSSVSDFNLAFAGLAKGLAQKTQTRYVELASSVITHLNT